MGVRMMKLNIIFALLNVWCMKDFVDAYCDTSNNGLTITCVDTFAGERTQLVLELKVCRSNPKVAVTVDIDALNIHIKKEGSDISIPLEIGKIIVSLSSKPNGELTISVKVDLPILPDITVYSATVNDENCNSIIYWFQSLSTIAIVGIGAGALLLLLFCCCCCYRCCCRKTPTPGMIIVPPPSMVLPQFPATVPYMKQQNEM